MKSLCDEFKTFRVVDVKGSKRQGKISCVNAEDLNCHPVEAARNLLGVELRVENVRVRVVEVEAYGGPEGGPWPDPAAHSYRGPTPRNRVMFGSAGRVYVYSSYGMHLCMNVTCGPDGEAAAVLLRAAELVDGEEAVRRRRGDRVASRKLVSGPGNLGQAIGAQLSDNGMDLFDGSSRIVLAAGRAGRPTDVAEGPRVGVSKAADRPWRFWIPRSDAVSAYRRSPRAPAS
ncbi:DNA-3-methyladenine glycosylase [Rhodococcoides fascians]|uniref:DNA-3-methyladenine glycosylase n=1 Tax=Rhodococcoides fascians TaxID=1828 RepID=UPI00055D85A3|nr:DNA-3-methyladenine glycosylase [Rhodococcus fascians]